MGCGDPGPMDWLALSLVFVKLCLCYWSSNTGTAKQLGGFGNKGKPFLFLEPPFHWQSVRVHELRPLDQNRLRDERDRAWFIVAKIYFFSEVKYYTTESLGSLFLPLVLEEALGILKAYMGSFPEGGKTAVLQNVTHSSGYRLCKLSVLFRRLWDTNWKRCPKQGSKELVAQESFLH